METIESYKATFMELCEEAGACWEERGSVARHASLCRKLRETLESYDQVVQSLDYKLKVAERARKWLHILENQPYSSE